MSTTYSDALKAFEQSSDWPLFYPRIYNNVGAYNPKTLSVGLYTSALCADVDRNVSRDYATVHYPTASMLINHAVPQYFVGKDLATCLLKTTPPDDLAFEDISWPFEAVAFHLPHGVLNHASEGTVDVVIVSLIKPGVYCVPCNPRYREIEILPESYTTFVVSTFMRESEEFVSYRASIPIHKFKTVGDSLAFLTVENFTATSYKDDNVIIAAFKEDGALKPATIDDAEFNVELFKLGINLLLTLDYQPDLIENEVKTKTLKREPTDFRPKEVWNPRFIGRNYRIEREYKGGTHASPRAHWRKGHWRNVRCGPMDIDKKARPTVRRRIPAVLVMG
jgi:hypothetical protein